MGSPRRTRPTAGSQPGERALATLSGLRHPMVAILLLISFFTAIGSKPLDGLLMLVVATGLAWDAGARSAHATGVDIAPGNVPRRGLAGDGPSGRPRAAHQPAGCRRR